MGTSLNKILGNVMGRYYGATQASWSRYILRQSLIDSRPKIDQPTKSVALHPTPKNLEKIKNWNYVYKKGI
jgi:hypothetical protein